MKRFWSMGELVERWSVGPTDLERMPDKLPSGRLGFIAQLAFYRQYVRFPEHRGEFAPCVIAHLAEQIPNGEDQLGTDAWKPVVHPEEQQTNVHP